ncbi:uncharacterized protein LOC130387879 [Gadus chalcogrammus]|uniref:uncharacterized protein LOC130387879 n=1 Tax=Gadus chalcogrammus TaxID=1042646 RepID=UPI0024C4754D|nr:uncharacterized protein LOC130387879 [Gadus chalcogrammus]
MQIFMLVVLFTGFTGDSHQQTIHSIQGSPVQALQGDDVTLSCNYSSATDFFWYRQYPSSPPQFLIKDYMELSGFTLKKDSDKKMFHLEISAAAVTDSALYYCAVQPTVTGNTDSLYKNLTRNLKSICHYLKLWFRGGASGEVNSHQESRSDYFFWYRQYPVEPPQFLLYISGLGINRTAESLGSDKRFSTELTEEKTGVDLKISSVASVKEKTE